MENSMNYLKTIPFSEFTLWDVKRFVKEGISSSFPIVDLGKYINQRSEKVKLFDFPEDDFGILGVNNKEGIFDAYTEKGKNINQAYKKVELNDLAYNPYRVNVGSIGWKTLNQVNNFISPAYVVFECLNGLNSEYLYRMFKTDTFNKIINDNTTGSVRQNLKYDTLKSIRIPLPPKEKQDRIVATYNQKITLAERQEEKAKQLEQDIEMYFFEVLGIEKLEKKERKLLRVINYSNLNRWDNTDTFELKSKYEILKVDDIITEISTGTTPLTSRKEYFENGKINFYSPADLTDIMYLDSSARKITKLALEDNKARKFEKGTLLFVGIGSTVGKVGIIRDDFATSNQQITGIKVDENKMNLEFVYYYFNQFKQITTVEKTQATIPIVNQNKILNIPIPIPPLKVQTKIANHISSLKSEIKKLKEQAVENRKQAITDFEKEIFS
ncbi:Type I restriction enzyme, S subunit [Tenacibaculum maritimum]|nr:Type I restriction enzyme, S subunit [Tenacibaculum maritimum]